MNNQKNFNDKTSLNKEYPKINISNKTKQNIINNSSRLTNLNFNLLRIILNFIPIDEIVLLLNIYNKKINKTFLEMNFIKIKKLILKSLSKDNKIEDVIRDLYKILRKENLESKEKSIEIIKKAVKNEEIYEKIEKEYVSLSKLQNVDFWKYLMKILCKEIKKIRLDLYIVNNEDVENLSKILSNNNSVFAISFLEENLHKKVCAEFFEKSLATNFTITKIPYFIYKNNSLTNEFHIGVNEIFLEIKNVDNKIKTILKNFFTLNKKFFIEKEEFLKFIFYEYVLPSIEKKMI